MTDDLSVFDLPEEGARKDPLATALAEAAAWQARAERLSRLMEALLAVVERDYGVDREDDEDQFGKAVPWPVRYARKGLTEARPSPSKLLEVVRRVLKWRVLEDAMPTDREISDEQLEEWSEVYDGLLCCPGLFTPEERAAILGEGE